MRGCVLLVLLGAVGLPLAGCIAVAAGAAAGYGAYEYSNGAYTVSLPGSVDQVWRATMATLEEDGAKIRGKTRERTEAQVRAVTADEQEVEIALARNAAGDFTRVTIRFGLMGDEPRSRALAGRIKEHL